MAKRAAAAILESVPNRSIYIRVKPAPAGLTERRSVLRALQRYGDIEVFKKQQDDSSFISVASTNATASTLIHNSPLQYEFGDDTAPRDPATLLSKARDASRKVFNVEIFPAPEYNHKTRIALSPLYGPWPDESNSFSDRRSFAFFALRRALPKNMAAKGMADWETGGQVEVDLDAPTDKLFHIQERKKRRDREKLMKEMESRLENAPKTEDASLGDISQSLSADTTEMTEKSNAEATEETREATP